MNEQNKGRLNEKEDGRKSSKMKKSNGDTMRGGENMVEKEQRVVEGKESDRNSYPDLDVTGVGKINDEELQKACANERKDKMQFRFYSGKRGNTRCDVYIL